MPKERKALDDLFLMADETDEVLVGLRALLEKATSPIVRVCLEEAHDDIAYLTGKPTLHPVEEDQVEAA